MMMNLLSMAQIMPSTMRPMTPPPVTLTMTATMPPPPRLPPAPLPLPTLDLAPTAPRLPGTSTGDQHQVGSRQLNDAVHEAPGALEYRLDEPPCYLDLF